MKRVLVIGSPGTGKTTFAREFARKTGLPLLHLDFYYHDKTKAYYLERNKEAWCAKVDELVGRGSWVIDGNYNSTLEARVARADTIILFDLARRSAIYGALKRLSLSRSRPRDDMPSDWKDSIDFAFLRYIWRFNRDKRPKILKIISEPKDKTLIIFKNHKQAKQYLEML